MRWRSDAGGPERVGWWLFALALALVLVTTLSVYLGWAVFGLFLYYVVRPVARRLRQRGVSPGLSAALSLGLIVFPFVVVLGVFVVFVLGELAAIEATDVERVIEALFPGLAVEAIPTSQEQLYVFVDTLRSEPTVVTLVALARGFVGTFTAQAYNAFLTFVFAFFLVRDERRLGEWFRTTVAEDGTDLVVYLRAVDRGLSSVYFGYTLTIIVIALVATVIYNLLNLIAPPGLAIPHAILLGVATGLISVVPLFGRSLLYGSVVLYLAITAFRSDPRALWFPVVFYVVMGILFDNVIRTYVRPYLSGRLFHTGLIMFAYLLGPVVFGWYGIFLGPFILVITVQFLQVQFPKLHSA
ncbi:AI-2E family transporter [Natranaeroarchaeum sulfidigenes]|uniref:Putative PurR-regulated permease PerM n=1 Tax=Natranaeroarchaeum sulfidigenes TaxID=2784880 RepID=A0A897MU65_9EURY|nr:AI-2E family transporter [Natranaeroarchaeum sulfidigenes]QSG01765.1 putative PurR-regulated permease PerM [Natranaeroarchaeum sulfidigenes]